MALTFGVTIEDRLVAGYAFDHLGQSGKDCLNRRPAYLRGLVEKDVEVFGAEDLVNALLIVESVHADEGAIGVPDLQVALQHLEFAPATEHLDQAIRP